jgi:YHS domain-containing protein
MRRPGSAPTCSKEMKRLAVDPICKMEVDPKTAKWKSEYNGKEYYFCAPGCKKAFDKNPTKYA